MLVLNRRDHESIYITVPPSMQPTVIRVALVEGRHEKARLGFEAPANVAIVREEVMERANAKHN